MASRSSSSVGAIGVRLAAGAGNKIVTVASKHNLDKAKVLRASAVFDYDLFSVTKGFVASAKVPTLPLSVTQSVHLKLHKAGELCNEC